MLLIYLLIGFTYTIINAFVRKLDTDGDWTLVFIWLFMWPICLFALLMQKMFNAIDKEIEKDLEQKNNRRSGL